MKTILTTLALGMALGTTTAGATQPLLVKTESNGAVTPVYQHTRTCSVYEDRVEIKATGGTTSATLTQTATLDASVATAISDAAKGTITKGPITTGGNRVTYVAYDASASDPTATIQLKTVAGTSVTNSSDAAVGLVNLLDGLCQ